MSYLIELYNIFCSYYNLSGFLLLTWQVIGITFAALLSISFIIFAKDIVFFSFAYWKKSKPKLLELWKNIVFFIYVKRAKPIYEKHLFSLKKITDKKFDKKNLCTRQKKRTR